MRGLSGLGWLPVACIDDGAHSSQVVQLYHELAAGFESMITEDLINSPPDRAAGAPPHETSAAAPAESVQRSDTISPTQPDGPASETRPDPPDAHLR